MRRHSCNCRIFRDKWAKPHFFDVPPRRVLHCESLTLRGMLPLPKRDVQPNPIHTLVPLRIEGYEMGLRKQAKAAGGRWNPEKQLWFVRYGNIVGTPLEKHIYVDAT